MLNYANAVNDAEERAFRAELLFILKHARKLLAKKGGWIQGRAMNGCGGYCATGALSRAWMSQNHKTYSQAEEILRHVIFGPNNCQSIPRWNDQPYRTKSQVLAAFSAAILKVQRVKLKAPRVRR